MKKLMDKLILPAREYIVTIVLFMIAAVLMMIYINNSYNEVITSDTLVKLMLTSLFGGVFSTTLKAFIKKFNLSYWYSLLTILAMLLVYYFIGDVNSVISALKFSVLTGVSILAFIVVPFIQKDEDSDYYTYKMLIALALTIIAYLTLIIGIMLTLSSIATLFEFDIPDEVFTNTMIGILGMIMPTVFLALIPQDELKREKYPNFILKIVSYAIVPIFSIYTIVIYAYLLKVLVLFKLPANVLGNLVIWYALISIILLYFSKGVDFSYKIVNRFMNLYPFALIIPVLVMMISFIVRIVNYGLTEPRYYALLVALIVLGSIYLMKKFNNVKYTLVLTGGLLLLSIVGPLSSYTLSSISQESRFEKLLVDYKMLDNNKIIANDKLSGDKQDEVLKFLYYFDERKQLDKLDFLPKDFEMKDCVKVFGFAEYLGPEIIEKS